MFNCIGALNAAVTRYECAKDPGKHTDILGLFLELKDIAGRYIRSGAMYEGQTYNVPLENGDTLMMKMFRSTAILGVKKPDGRIKQLISREDSLYKDYSLLEAYTMGLEPIGIGRRYPDKLRDMIQQEFKPGRIISFDGGDKAHQFSVVCTREDKNIKYIKPIYYGDVKDITVASFMDIPEQPLDIYENLQGLYNTAKTMVGNIIPRQVDINTTAQEQINNLYSNLKAGHTAVLQYGNERLRVQKSLFGKGLSWYDKNGRVITEQAAKVFIAWCHCTPVITEFKYDETVLENDIKAYSFYEEYEHALINKDYRHAVGVLCRASTDEALNFSVNITSHGNDANLTATTFVFKSVGDECHIYKKTVSGMSIDDTSASMEEIDADEFVRFCNNRYDAVKNAIYVEKTREYSKGMSHISATQQRIIENAALKSADKILESVDAIGADIRETEQADSSLINSYIEYKETDSESVIFDKDLGVENHEKDTEEIEDR